MFDLLHTKSYQQSGLLANNHACKAGFILKLAFGKVKSFDFEIFCLILTIFFRNCGISNHYVSVGNFPIVENLYTSFVDNRVDKPRLVLKSLTQQMYAYFD